MICVFCGKFYDGNIQESMHLTSFLASSFGFSQLKFPLKMFQVMLLLLTVFYLILSILFNRASQVAQVVKNLSANAGDIGLIPV